MKLPNLKSMLNNYEETLCDKLFFFELNHKWQVKLEFYREDFCHLVGLHHVYGRDKRYLGLNGYRKVNSDEITLDSIKKHNIIHLCHLSSKAPKIGTRTNISLARKLRSQRGSQL